MKIIEKTSIMSALALSLVVWSMFPHENSTSLLCYNRCSFTWFTSCDSENSLKSVIIIGKTYIPWSTDVLNVCLR